MLLQQNGISFQQALPGCVTLSFSAETTAANGALIELKAVLDGNSEASPWATFAGSEVDSVHTRTFNFLFASVSAGPHRIELQIRNAGESGAVKLGMRTSVVQFAM